MTERIKTLFVDNGTESIHDYQNLFNRCDFTIVTISDLTAFEGQGFGLIILSDGHLVNVKNNLNELELVMTTSIPVIGICYGFQLLSVAYGAKICELRQKREGIVSVQTKSEHPILNGITIFNAIEKHRFTVSNIDNYPDLICHAISIDGCEIIEVKDKRQFGFQFHPEIQLNENQGSIIVGRLINHWFPEQ